MTTSVKMNPRVQGIRDRVGPSEPQVKATGPARPVSKATMKKTLAILKYQGSKTLKELAEYQAKMTAYNSAMGLVQIGAASAVKDDPDNPKSRVTFAYLMTPEGWDLEDVEPVVKGKSKGGKDPTDNPLTWMLAKKNPTVRMNAIESYNQLIKDTSGFYGPRELQQLIEAIHEICKLRINQATVDCPICDKPLSREGSGVYCKTCKRSYDAGDSAKSLEEYLRIATILEAKA